MGQPIADKGWGMEYTIPNGGMNLYHPGYDYNKPEKAAMAAENEAIQRYSQALQASKSVMAYTANQIWNSELMRWVIADTYYVNVSGVLTFIGGGGADIGLALVIRGQNAGNLYATSTLKGKLGYNFGVSANVGRAMYTGRVQDYNFEDTFLGKSAGLESDFIVGVSLSAGEKDAFNQSLILFDAGYGPSIGASVNIGAITYQWKRFKFW